MHLSAFVFFKSYPPQYSGIKKALTTSQNVVKAFFTD